MYEGKIAIVTGASRGVGYAISRHFLDNGATVIGLSRGSSTINNASYFHYTTDLSKTDEISACFRRITKEHGYAHILVNNAAVLTSQYSMIMPVSKALEMIQVNLLAVFLLSREAAKLMRKSSYGRIINISSMAVSLEPAGDSVYAATKAGITTLANVMAKEYAAMNITCNTLGITAIETEMLGQLPRHKVDEIIARLPVPRYAENDDVFNVIDFFASESSSYVTAQTIYLGGIS